jgi:hypothetical protein
VGGPAQAIHNVPGFDRLVGKPFRLTTVHSLLGVHRVRDLRREAVGARRLMLPPEYSQTAWPGSSIAPTGSDAAAR